MAAFFHRGFLLKNLLTGPRRVVSELLANRLIGA